MLRTILFSWLPLCDPGQVLPSHFWQVFQLSAVSVVFSCLAEQDGINEWMYSTHSETRSGGGAGRKYYDMTNL